MGDNDEDYHLRSTNKDDEDTAESYCKPVYHHIENLINTQICPTLKKTILEKIRDKCLSYLEELPRSQSNASSADTEDVEIVNIKNKSVQELSDGSNLLSPERIESSDSSVSSKSGSVIKTFTEEKKDSSQKTTDAAGINELNSPNIYKSNSRSSSVSSTSLTPVKSTTNEEPVKSTDVSSLLPDFEKSFDLPPLTSPNAQAQQLQRSDTLDVATFHATNDNGSLP